MFRHFRCPHCSELIQEKPLAGPGGVGRIVAATAVLLFFLTGRIGWSGYFAACFLGVPLLITIVHALVIRVLGYTLEPAGRLPLGESEDEE
jgi:hypothetical protein